MSAYSKALAWESVTDDLRSKWDQESETYSDVTNDELESFAKIVAYKVAANLRNGHRMNFDIDPLNYGGYANYPKNPPCCIIKS